MTEARAVSTERVQVSESAQRNLAKLLKAIERGDFETISALGEMSYVIVVRVLRAIQDGHDLPAFIVREIERLYDEVGEQIAGARAVETVIATWEALDKRVAVALPTSAQSVAIGNAQ
jgi:hypothetical protein